MLRLQAEPGARSVLGALLAGDVGDAVARVELQARLGREDVERAAGPRLVQPDRVREARAVLIQHEVVIVAAGKSNLPVIRIDAVPDPAWTTKIKRRACNCPQFPQWNECRIYWCKQFREEGKFVVENISRRMSGEVKYEWFVRLIGVGLSVSARY